MMKRNFRARGAPLLGANASLAAAEARCGAFATKSALSMREVYRRVVLGQPEEFRRVAALEIFDDPDQRVCGVAFDARGALLCLHPSPRVAGIRAPWGVPRRASSESGL